MQYEAFMNHRWLKNQIDIVKLGLEFPRDSISGILLTNTDKEKIKVSENKERVLDFIQTKKKVYFSEISKKFNLDIVETKLILNELEKEDKIKLNE